MKLSFYPSNILSTQPICYQNVTLTYYLTSSIQHYYSFPKSSSNSSSIKTPFPF